MIVRDLACPSIFETATPTAPPISSITTRSPFGDGTSGAASTRSRVDGARSLCQCRMAKPLHAGSFPSSSLAGRFRCEGAARGSDGTKLERTGGNQWEAPPSSETGLWLNRAIRRTDEYVWAGSFRLPKPGVVGSSPIVRFAFTKRIALR